MPELVECANRYYLHGIAVYPYLEVIATERLVWTSALAPGYRPVLSGKGDMPFTATILFEAVPGGTKYTAIAVHGTESAKLAHEEMGFVDGWGTCLDQLVACIKANEIR
jgi:uncharacterized protein YndB with AHSA1/START domain